MKVFIKNSENGPEVKIYQHFGHSLYFIGHDLKTKEIEFIPKPNKNILEKAESAFVQLISSCNLQKIISGEFGFKIMSLFYNLRSR